MKRLGIETGAALHSKTLAFLEAHFGSSAGWCHGIARGLDNRPVNPDRTRKSSGTETTFDRDLTDPAEIEVGVLRMADDVWAWCEKARACSRTVTVKIKFQTFRQITRSRSHLPRSPTAPRCTAPASISSARSTRPRPASGWWG